LQSAKTACYYSQTIFLINKNISPNLSNHTFNKINKLKCNTTQYKYRISKQNKNLIIENKQLKTKNKTLTKEIQQLKQKLNTLTQQLQNLENQTTLKTIETQYLKNKLNKNNQNSHKPPSQNT
jgi:predicted RNase H-like nuclease (RuvC/YqgF family)